MLYVLQVPCCMCCKLAGSEVWASLCACKVHACMIMISDGSVCQSVGRSAGCGAFQEGYAPWTLNAHLTGVLDLFAVIICNPVCCNNNM